MKFIGPLRQAPLSEVKHHLSWGTTGLGFLFRRNHRPVEDSRFPATRTVRYVPWTGIDEDHKSNRESSRGRAELHPTLLLFVKRVYCLYAVWDDTAICGFKRRVIDSKTHEVLKIFDVLKKVPCFL